MRHLPTAYNSGEGGAEKSRSWSNISIDDKSSEPLANKAAKVFDSHGVSVITSSDLNRSKESAELVASKMEDKPELINSRGARTWNTGPAGKPERESREERKTYAQHPDEEMPGGESFNDFRARSSGFLSTELRKAAADPDKKRAIVLHGHQVMDAEAGLNDEPNEAKHWKMLDDIKPGQIMELTDGPNGAKLTRL